MKDADGFSVYNMIFVWIGVILAVVGADQLSKYLTVLYLKPVQDIPLIPGWLHLSYVENTGAAFGMLKDQRWLFIILSGIGICAMAVYLVLKRKTMHPLLSAALAMVIGGGLGNQIDRIVQGYVVDMIYVKIIDFAVFNLADSFVCIGAACLFIYILFFDENLRNDRTKKKSEAAPRKTSEHDDGGEET